MNRSERRFPDFTVYITGIFCRTGCDVILTFDKRASGTELFELLE